MFHVYILECADHSLYVGHAQDVNQRLATHQQGFGPAYTAIRRPVRLLYSEPHMTLETAIRRENQLKRWSRAKKLALVMGDAERLHHLSQCRRRRKSS